MSLESSTTFWACIQKSDIVLDTIYVLCATDITLCYWEQSLHPAAEYHAAARAIGGCAVYVRWATVLNLSSHIWSVLFISMQK